MNIFFTQQNIIILIYVRHKGCPTYIQDRNIHPKCEHFYQQKNSNTKPNLYVFTICYGFVAIVRRGVYL